MTSVVFVLFLANRTIIYAGCWDLLLFSPDVRLNSCATLFFKSKFRNKICVSRIELAHFEFVKQYDTHPFFYSFHNILIPQLQMLLAHSQKAITRISSARWWASTHPYFMFWLTFWHLFKSTKQKALLSKIKFFLVTRSRFIHFSCSFPHRKTTYYLFGKIIFYSISNSGIYFILDGKGTSRKYCSVGMVCGAYLNCFLRE